MASAATSSASMRPAIARKAKPFKLSRKRPEADGAVREVSFFEAVTGTPSIRTTWQPMLNRGAVFDSSTASANAVPFAIRVEDVTTPRVCASMMARFTPEVKPKSSALTINRRTRPV